MATVVDALIVTLGLDPSQFVKAQKETTTSFKKTGEAAVKTGKDIEASGKNAAEAISRLRDQVIELFAVFAGATGLKDLIEKTTQADAALGRLSANIAEAPEVISNFENAGRLLGASADDMASAFVNVNDVVAEFLANGQVPSRIRGILYALHNATGQNFDLKKSPAGTILDISKALTKLYATNPGEANYLGRQMGFTPGAVNALEHYQQLLAALKKTAAYDTTRNDVAKATALYKAYELAAEAATRLAQTIRNDLEPPLLSALNGFKEIFEYLNQHVHVAEAAMVAFGVGTLKALEKLSPIFKPTLGFFAELAGTLTKIGTAIALISTALDKLGDESVWDWLDKKVKILGYIDDWVSRMTGGAVGRSYAEQNGTKGAAPSKSATKPSSGVDSWWKDVPGTQSASPGPSTPYGQTSKAQVEAYIKQAAVARGIDPNVALRVAQSEGLNGYIGDYGTSFGPYQLHYGGSGIPGMNSSGLGDAFTRKTGLNARDPKTWKQQVDFSLDNAKKGGWTPWHGAARVGISRWQGINASPVQKAMAPIGPQSMLNTLRMIQVARAASVSNVHHDARDQSTTTTHIGNINLPGVKDANDFARALPSAISINSLAMSSNAGLA